ncbi:hypothetical protein [Lysobacter enzymogenes]|uniref:hypothetical protein n=1 Tax=Lysobacter enzymogenes TaxID=69 RepID=UPI000F4BF0A3|nr:hypothetical protein [Lysobacter enzymogenes]
MDSPAISYVRKNRGSIIVSHDLGGEVVAKLVESAIVDGVGGVDVLVGDGIYAVSTDREWVVREAFHALLPYPEIAVNSARLEILVSAFFDWFSVRNHGVEAYSCGAVPEQVGAVILGLKYPFVLAFGRESGR